MTDLSVEVGSIKLKNPLMLASGICGYGDGFKEFYSPEKLGAVVTKGISLKPREGNQPPRIAEVNSGMLNSVGLENIGVERFIKEKLPLLIKLKAKVVVNIFGERLNDYVELSERLSKEKGIIAIELNLSCPNVERGAIEFGRDPKTVQELVKEVRSHCKIPLLVKLSAMVSDLVELSRSAIDAGADALTLINTVPAMAIDLKTRRPVLKNIFGGLSGPAIKPIALRAVYIVKKNLGLPVIGVGGISSYEDALEFFIAGADAVQVGSSALVNPYLPLEIIKGIKKFIKINKLKNMGELFKFLRSESRTWL